MITLGRLVMILALAAPFAPAQSLDYEMFRSKVEPIFLKKRPTHARCIVCHEGTRTALQLQPLPEGKTTWTEEQSKKNFEAVSRLVVPGKPDESHLLLYPLVPQEGGSAYHSGGRQWPTKQDPTWQTIARWVKGQK